MKTNYIQYIQIPRAELPVVTNYSHLQNKIAETSRKINQIATNQGNLEELNFLQEYKELMLECYRGGYESGALECLQLLNTKMNDMVEYVN